MNCVEICGLIFVLFGLIVMGVLVKVVCDKSVKKIFRYKYLLLWCYGMREFIFNERVDFLNCVLVSIENFKFI